jgi:SAM-dependent methyltransferase
MFALTVPGLAPLLSKELRRLPGVNVKETGFDGRSDVVVFEAAAVSRKAVLSVGLAEDVFVEVGRTLRSEGDRPGWIANRIWRPERVQRALSAWATAVRPLHRTMSYRLISRVLQERSFLRTDLRRHMSELIRQDRPKWRIGDPAQLEVWIIEYRSGRFLCGLRLSDSGMRQHQGRQTERTGALRPTVAHAMVTLAGTPSGELLDPCCGSGTILSEALATGWTARGRDIDPAAVKVAHRNVPEAEVRSGDVRSLDLPDGSVDACVCNLPFGRQYEYDGDPTRWLTAALGEMVRVTRPGSRIVLLVPEVPSRALPGALRERERLPIRLLGTRTVIRAYDR